MSYQSKDYPAMSNSKKDRSYYSSYKRREDKFITDGDSDGYGRGGVGPRTTHFYSHKIFDFGIERNNEGLCPYQSHCKIGNRTTSFSSHKSA